MLIEFICKAVGHRVDRRRVWHDGMDFRATCRRCKKPLLREWNGWRRFNVASDEHKARRPHPNTA